MVAAEGGVETAGATWALASPHVTAELVQRVRFLGVHLERVAAGSRRCPRRCLGSGPRSVKEPLAVLSCPLSADGAVTRCPDGVSLLPPALHPVGPSEGKGLLGATCPITLLGPEVCPQSLHRRERRAGLRSRPPCPAECIAVVTGAEGLRARAAAQCAVTCCIGEGSNEKWCDFLFLGCFVRKLFQVLTTWVLGPQII